MTMTTRSKRTQTKSTAAESVTVTVVEPHLVYHDGEQRSGVLKDVPADLAEYWERHGWATVNDDKPAKPRAESKPTGDKYAAAARASDPVVRSFRTGKHPPRRLR